MASTSLTTEVREALAEYLARRPVLVQLLHEAARRYRTYGLAGTIALETVEEREAVSAITASLHGRRQDKVRVVELDRAFREGTRFGVGLVDVLAVVLNAPVVTNAERASARAAAQDAHEMALRTAGADGATICGGAASAGWAAVEAWLAVDRDSVRSAVPDPFSPQAAQAENALEAARTVARALGAIRVMRSPCAVPVLAQRVAGYPHALDNDTPAGRLLDRALALTLSSGVAYPLEDAEAREILYGTAGLMVDELSSGVSIYHLLGAAPLLAGARAQNVPITLPLAAIGELGDVYGARGLAYVVENPAVFMAVVGAARELPPEVRPTVVCTAGQLSVAARRLLDAVVARGTQLLYSGDFDVNGLAIARGIVQRWPAAAQLWRMDAPSYEVARRRPGAARRLAPIPRERVAAVADSFPELAHHLATSGPAYQEALITELVADVLAPRENDEVAARGGTTSAAHT